MQSSNHSAADIYWGELGGVLECLDAGTTTVVDYAHMMYSPEHGKSLHGPVLSRGCLISLQLMPPSLPPFPQASGPFLPTQQLLELNHGSRSP
jgi:hypothetical protein